MTAKKTKAVKPAKKASNKKPPKEKKKSAPLAAAGHNSAGHVNKPLLKLFDEFEKMNSNKKQITKAQADIKAKAKEQFGIQKDVFDHEIRMRKKESAARIQFEQGHNDLKGQLGYQFALELAKPQDEDEETDEETGEKRGSFRDVAKKQDDGEPKPLEEGEEGEEGQEEE